MSFCILVTYWIFHADTPTGYMSEDGGSPRPVDPNAMDVDSVNSPPAVSPQTGEWKIVEFQLLCFHLCRFMNACSKRK